MSEPPTRVTLMVPAPIAEELSAGGLALPLSTRRSPAPELVIQVAGVGATAISLLQGPETIRELARLLYTWTCGHSRSNKGGETHLIASGPGGRLELTTTETTDMAELESLLQSTVFGRSRDRPDVGS